MKIAFVSQPIDTLLPPFQNSVGACTYGAATSLAASSDVTVYGLQDENTAESEVLHRGVQYRFFPRTFSDRLIHRVRTKASKLIQLKPASVSRWLFPNYGRDVALALAKEHFDVIHIQHCSQYIPFIREMNPRSKIVLHLHAEWFTQCVPYQLATRVSGLDLLTGVSDHITDKTRKQLPAFAGRCETTYNGINADEFSRDKDYGATAKRKTKRIMYAGGVSPHKGIHVLVDAFKIVAAKYPDVRLDIIGPHGTYPLEETFDLRDREAIKNVAHFYPKGLLPLLKNKLSGSTYGSENYLPYVQSKITPEIADKVSFLGMIPRPELVQNYYDCDVFVFPPIWDEGFGLPPVEAMAAGTAVVATRSGAIVETVQQGHTGLLVEKNDPQALAQALLDLLTNDAMRERMGKAGRDRAMKHFTWDRVAEKMYSRYQALCSSAAAETPGASLSEQLSI